MRSTQREILGLLASLLRLQCLLREMARNRNSPERLEGGGKEAEQKSFAFAY